MHKGLKRYKINKKKKLLIASVMVLPLGDNTLTHRITIVTVVSKV